MDKDEKHKAQEIQVYDRRKKSRRAVWGQQWDAEIFRLVDSDFSKVTIKATNLYARNKIVMVPGVGHGTDIGILSKGSQIIGFDLSIMQIQDTKKNHEDSNLSLVVADAEFLPIRNSTIDTIWCRAILHHLPNLGRAVQEFSESLMENGFLVVIEPGKINPVAMIARRFFPTDIHTPGEEPFIPSLFESTIEKCGYSKVASRRFFLFVFLMPVFVKWFSFTKSITPKIIEVINSLEMKLFSIIPPISELCWIFMTILQKHIDYHKGEERQLVL